MKKYLYIISIFLSISWIISFCIFNWYLWFVYPDRELYPIMGIDVSHHQWVIDWKKVNESWVWFIYLKATEWDDWIDKKFEVNYLGAKLNHIPVWAYHFYSLRIAPELQLKNIVNTLSGKILDLPIVVDLEFWWNSQYRPSIDSLQKDLIILLDGIEKFQNKKPIVYITYEFKDQYLSWFKKYPIWIRDILWHPYNDLDWIIWQYKNRWHISWIDGFVDLNVLSWSIDQLLK